MTGIAEKVLTTQERASRAEGRALQVALELQANFYACVWAAKNRDKLDRGDVEGGLRAAQAIGGDTLQKAAGERVVPDSVTYWSAAQRRQWLLRGLQTSDPAQCDMFGTS